MFKNGAATMGIIAALIIGAIAGWLAGLVVRGAGVDLASGSRNNARPCAK